MTPTLAAAVASVAVAISIVGGVIAKMIVGWTKANHRSDKQAEQINVALFGREEDGALPKINGLIFDNKKTQICLGAMATSIQRIDIKLAGLDTKTSKLVERTQANGGDSIKDQITRIDERGAQISRIEDSAGRIEDSRARLEEHDSQGKEAS